MFIKDGKMKDSTSKAQRGASDGSNRSSNRTTGSSRISNGSAVYVSKLFLPRVLRSIAQFRAVTLLYFPQQLGTELGRGAFGIVYQAFNVDTGDFVAVKRHPIKSIDDEALAAVEVDVLCFLFSCCSLSLSVTA